jgi:hypothetical protein
VPTVNLVTLEGGIKGRWNDDVTVWHDLYVIKGSSLLLPIKFVRREFLA